MCKAEGSSPLGRLRHRCKDNIKTYLKEIGWERMNWIDLHQDRDRWWTVLNALINLLVP